MEILVIKFLNETISEEELNSLRNWLQEPKNQNNFKAIVRANQQLDLVYYPIDAEAAYQRILDAIPYKEKTTKKLYRTLLKYAAIVIFLIATTIGLYTIFKTDDTILISPIAEKAPQITLELEDGSIQILNEKIRTTIINKEGNAVVAQEYDKLVYKQDNKEETVLAYNQLTVPYSKRFKIQLSDGTNIFLNAGTKIRYPKVFLNTHKREVYLDGEAYFEVAEKKNQPFIIHTEEMDIEVLGTKFNVSSYQNENNTSTTLVEGSVQISSSYLVSDSTSPSVILKPGQQAIMSKEGFSIQKVNIEKQIAWTEGKLYFVNDRFENIIKELERHYNVNIQNKYPELNNMRYTGTFLTETIIQVLNTFKSNTHFEYQIKNNTIIIKP